MSTAAVSLHHIAPRLARARDAWLAHRRAEAAWTVKHVHDLLRAERLVAHRDLQLARAYATGDGRYIARRQRKLDDALRELARLEEMEPPA